MSETTNTTKQFLDKGGLDALWNKICSIFASKQELEDIRNEIPTIVQSDWDEIDESSAAFIKNKTHGITLIDVRTAGSYTHTSDITYIKHFGNTFELELGVKTQINGGPPVYVTLTSSNTILIEEVSSGWVNAHPVSIIDIKKIDIKYLPDEVLNNSDSEATQSDWNESDSGLPSYINGRTHYINYHYNTINSTGQYNLDDYNAIYPVIIYYNKTIYELYEGDNRLSWGPPMLVNLSGNTLTIDESSYVNENYAIKIATDIQKLNPMYLNTITLDMLDNVWEDIIGHEYAILDEGTLNTRKLG